MLPFKQRERRRRLSRRLASMLAAVLAALAIRALVIQAYRIPSGSMEDTLLAGDYLMAAKFLYGIREPFGGRLLVPALRSPEPGEVLVFGYPIDGRDFIKRCVAAAGETVSVKGGRLIINGAESVTPQAVHKAPPPVEERVGTARGWSAFYQRSWEERRFLPLTWVRDDFGPVAVPQGHLFMMGDNRDNSMDSRFWGPLPVSEVRGKALFIYWSWDHEGRAPAWQFWRRVRWGRIGRAIK